MVMVEIKDIEEGRERDMAMALFDIAVACACPFGKDARMARRIAQDTLKRCGLPLPPKREKKEVAN